MSVQQNRISRAAHVVPLHSSDARSKLIWQALAIKDNAGYEIIPFDEIIRIEADGNYSRIFQMDGSQIMTCQTLKLIAGQLPESLFIRIHQSHIVAIRHIRRLDSNGLLTLSDTNSVPYSRRQKSQILGQLGLR
jgi:two-component system LytT family response regulator